MELLQEEMKKLKVATSRGADLTDFSEMNRRT